MELLVLNPDRTLNIFDKKPDEVIEFYAVFIGEDTYRYILYKYMNTFGFYCTENICDGKLPNYSPLFARLTIQETCCLALRDASPNRPAAGVLKIFMILYRDISEYNEFAARMVPIFEEAALLEE